MIENYLKEMQTLQENMEKLQVERLKLIGILEEHLSPDLVTEILQGETKSKLGGARETVVVLFCDIRGFTRFTASEPADAVVEHLNQFFHAMTKVLFSYNATVDKFIGDSIMAYFKTRNGELETICDSAVKCAAEMRDKFAGLSAEWKIGKNLGLGIGLSFGEVVLGYVGSGRHVDYTVIGSPVNLASRLCSAAASEEILIDANVKKNLEDNRWEPLPPLKLKGFDSPVEAFRESSSR